MIEILELANGAYIEIKEILGDKVFVKEIFNGLNAWYVTLNENVILKYSNSMLVLDLGGRKVMIDNREFFRVILS